MNTLGHNDDNKGMGDKIIIRQRAVDYTEGEMAWFCFCCRHGTQLHIDWGDGHVSDYDGHRLVHHDYGQGYRESERPFTVEITTDRVTFCRL